MVVLMGDIVGIARIVGGQALRVALPLVQMVQPLGNPLLLHRARHGWGGVPVPHASIGCRLYSFPFPNDGCHGMFPECADAEFHPGRRRVIGKRCLTARHRPR